LLRADSRLANLPVEVVTTGCAPAITQALSELGADCHVKAPRFDEFKDLLQRLLKRVD